MNLFFNKFLDGAGKIRSGEAFFRLLGIGRIRLHKFDLSGGDFFLSDAAGLGGARGNQWLGTILQLPGTTCGNENIAVMAIELIFEFQADLLT